MKIGQYIKVDFKGVIPQYVEQSSTIVLNQKCIRNGIIDFSEGQYISDRQTITPTKYVKEGDMLICSTGQGTAGRCAYVSELPETYKVTIDSHILVCRCNDNKIAAALAYIIFSLQSIVMTFLTGSSGQAELDKERLYNINFALPKDEQLNNAILFLQRLDVKINLNNQINCKLETIARELYNYWFVQFDFPNKKGKPYKTSGGKMVYSEHLKREVPEGWDILSINDMASSCRGVSYDKNDLLPNPEGGVLVLRGNNIQNNNLVFDSNVAYVPDSLISDEQHIKKHDIILTMSSGSKEHIGKCTMFQSDSPHTFGAFLSKFTPHDDKPYFVFNSMNTDYFKQKIRTICNGTGINNLTNKTFDEILFPVPDSITMAKYEAYVSTLYMQINNNNLITDELTSFRDELLPLLMNGQVTVSDVEKAVDNVITFKEKDTQDQRFELWLQNQGVAARGNIDLQTLRTMFNAMDEDD